MKYAIPFGSAVTVVAGQPASAASSPVTKHRQKSDLSFFNAVLFLLFKNQSSGQRTLAAACAMTARMEVIWMVQPADS
ncbi:MAG: hypothetical protein SOY37_00090, partial [Oscillospiraceae bacterium]|nr:hypothetical protein [Oscillospiraceae bacterium]